MINSTNYTMSFTAASLMKPESRALANAYVQNQGWADVEKLVLQENILGTRTISSAKRLYRELRMRLRRLNNKTLSYLANEATDEEQSQILWYSVCETYPFGQPPFSGPEIKLQFGGGGGMKEVAGA